jgi:hypothetical protein
MTGNDDHAEPRKGCSLSYAHVFVGLILLLGVWMLGFAVWDRARTDPLDALTGTWESYQLPGRVLSLKPDGTGTFGWYGTKDPKLGPRPLKWSLNDGLLTIEWPDHRKAAPATRATPTTRTYFETDGKFAFYKRQTQ